MQILLPTDVFPPKSGGAGWSTHALALALLAHGHDVTAIVPQMGRHGSTREDVLGVPTIQLGYRAPNIPFVKNYFRHERLWPKLAGIIAQTTDERRATAKERASRSSVVGRRSSVVIHAQHVQVAPAAIMAGQRLGVPVVVTVRDHWPWDYFATGLHGNRIPYNRQNWAALATDLVAREGPLRGAAALPALLYVQAHMRRRQRFLRQADAVIAVSNYIAERLKTIVPAERIHVIPNIVDIEAIRRTIATPPQSIQEPFLLFVGKLDMNKGADLLVDIFRALVKDGGRWAVDGGGNTVHRPLSTLPQLVIAGDGPLQPLLKRELAALGVRTTFLAWADHDEVLRLMAHCELLLFPSAWGEPLSRVWLEAAACGAPILAMPTGGIHDVIVDGVNGALAPTAAAFAARMNVLLTNPQLRRTLGKAAQQTARQRFSSERVIGQIEALYKSLGEHHF